MKLMAFLLLLLSFNSFANIESSSIDCKIDKTSKLTASGEGSLLIDHENGIANINFAVLSLYMRTDSGALLKTSTNTINNVNPRNEAPTLQGEISFENDETYGSMEALYSPKFDTMELSCSSSQGAYLKTTFKTKRGNVYTMLCSCPVE